MINAEGPFAVTIGRFLPPTDIRVPAGGLRHPRRISQRVANLLAVAPALVSGAVVWLDLAGEPVVDWPVWRDLWHAFLTSLEAHWTCPVGVGVAGTALLIPGDTCGHLAAEYVVAATPDRFGKPWVGVPLDPVLAGYHLSKRHVVHSRLVRPLEAFSRLGLGIQGYLTLPAWEHADEEGFLSDLAEGSRSDRLAAYVALFPEIDRLCLLAAGEARVWEMPGQHYTPHKRQQPRQHLSIREPLASRIWQESTEGYGLGTLERIELFLVVAGRKDAMRFGIAPTRWPRLRSLLDSLGISWSCHERTARYLTDRGKGGWSNLLAGDDQNRPAREDVFVYIATDRGLAERLASLEGGDDATFGATLGYPECCRVAFDRMFPLALRHQGDLVPIVADQTSTPQPWSFLLNMATRYFEASLLSFYPCSFDCRKARAIAEGAFDALSQVAINDARALRRVLGASVLYTEYQGIYAFPETSWDGHSLRYGPVLSTTKNRVGALLQGGDLLVPVGPGHFEVARSGRVLGTIGGTNPRLLAFSVEV